MTQAYDWKCGPRLETTKTMGRMQTFISVLQHPRECLLIDETYRTNKLPGLSGVLTKYCDVNVLPSGKFG